MAPDRWNLTDEEILAQIAAAQEREERARPYEVRAVSVRYEPETELTIVELENGCLFSIPPHVDELATLSPEERTRVRLHPCGDTLFWDGTDAAVLLPLLMTGMCPGVVGVEGSPFRDPAPVVEQPARQKRSA
jgi:hypothetical protein